MIKFLNPLKAAFAIVLAVAISIGIFYAVTGKSEAQEATITRILMLQSCFGATDWVVFELTNGFSIRHIGSLKDRAALKVLVDNYPTETLRPDVKSCM